MNEEIKLNKEWLDLLLEHKNNANLLFNLSENDTRILLTYIEVLQQENARLKDKIKTAFEYVDGLTPAGYNSGDIYSDVQDKLLELLKEN